MTCRGVSSLLKNHPISVPNSNKARGRYTSTRRVIVYKSLRHMMSHCSEKRFHLAPFTCVQRTDNCAGANANWAPPTELITGHERVWCREKNETLEWKEKMCRVIRSEFIMSNVDRLVRMMKLAGDQFSLHYFSPSPWRETTIAFGF